MLLHGCALQCPVRILCVLEGRVLVALALHSGDVLHLGTLVGLLVHVVVRLDVGHAAGVAWYGSVVGFARGVGRLTFLEGEGEGRLGTFPRTEET